MKGETKKLKASKIKTEEEQIDDLKKEKKFY